MPPPIVDLLYAVYELQEDGRDNVDLGDVKQYPGKVKKYDFSKYDKNQLGSWFSGLHSLVPQLVIFNESTKTVEIHSKPNIVLAAVASAISEMPEKVANAVKEALPKDILQAKK
jgi:hypothetical protein